MNIKRGTLSKTYEKYEFFEQFAQERIPHIALFQRAKRAIRSQSIFKMSDFEQKIEERMSEFPTLGIVQYRLITPSHMRPIT